MQIITWLMFDNHVNKSEWTYLAPVLLTNMEVIKSKVLIIFWNDIKTDLSLEAEIKNLYSFS
jgi:hypothetical protein